VIDPSLFTLDRLLATLLDDRHGNRDRWRKFAEIVPHYMPPHPSSDTLPKCVVCFEHSFLRYSHGPRQGFFWDEIYGDDMMTPELALVALMQAPMPPTLVDPERWRRWWILEHPADDVDPSEFR